jgi:hypothetical protein
MSRKKRKTARSKQKFKTVQFWVSLASLLVLLALFLGLPIYATARYYLLDKHTERIRAVVTNEKKFSRGRGLGREETYAYKFQIDEKWYYGDTRDTRRGNSILVEYVPFWPRFNRPVVWK